MESTPLIGIIDYGSGNLRSVRNALETVGARVECFNSADRLPDLDAVVLPGVGSFGDAARNLRATGLWDEIPRWIAADRPFLGICLGYQLLFESSEEAPAEPGLGVLAGTVRRFPSTDRKVPHMGWNTLTTAPGSPLFENLSADPAVYFVHSFYPDPTDASVVSATCDYGFPFAAAVSRSRMHATQFHPEKSQAVGLRILANFLHSLTADVVATSH